jgi:hypothetical protein
MKKIAIIIIIVVIVILEIIYFDKPKNTNKEQWMTYSNPKYGFEIKYPKKLKLSAINIEEIPNNLHDVAFIYANATSTYLDNNFVTVSYSPTIENVFAYFPVPDGVENNLAGYVGYYKDHMEEFKNFPPNTAWSEVTVNGVKYHKMTADKIQSYFVEHNNGIYILTFSTASTIHADLGKYIPEILDNFKLTK